MDQSAFRNLLSAPRSDAGPSKTHQKGNFAGAAPKRGWGIKQTKDHKKPLPFEAGEKKEDAHIAPRHVQKRQELDSKYKDRAELRRKGQDDEYKDVKEMLEDFEKRKAEAEDAESVEKTRQYLGGDATHSILVKGLDYSLLAQRKAELERERETTRDEELDEMMDNFGSKSGPLQQTKKEEPKEEKLGKGFKSIGARKEEAAPKKKKKKKVVKDSKPELPVPEPVKVEVPENKSGPATVKAEPIAVEARSRPAPPVAAPAPDEPEEDIFGDAGEYDLHAALPSEDEDDDEDEGEVVDLAKLARGDEPPRGRSRSREGDEFRESAGRDSRSRSWSRDRYRRRPDSRDGYDRYPPPHYVSRDRDDGRSRFRSRSRTPPRRRYRSESRTPPPGRYRSRSRTPPGRRHRSRSRTPRRRLYRSPSRSPPRRRYHPRSRSPYGDKRRRYDSPPRSSPRRRRSPPPYARSHRDRSPSSPPPRRRSPSPPPRAKIHRRSRSPSPLRFDGPPLSRSPSASRSPSPVLQGGKLQPLQSSAITDLSGFLAAESASAKADEKKVKKAQWRAKQGLGIQEGVDPGVLKREMNDKQKSNREYVLLMNKLKKDEAAEGSKKKDD